VKKFDIHQDDDGIRHSLNIYPHHYNHWHLVLATSKPLWKEWIKAKEQTTWENVRLPPFRTDDNYQTIKALLKFQLNQFANEDRFHEKYKAFFADCIHLSDVENIINSISKSPDRIIKLKSSQNTLDICRGIQQTLSVLKCDDYKENLYKLI